MVRGHQAPNEEPQTLSPVVNEYTFPISSKYPTGATWGRPSGRTVAKWATRGSERRSEISCWLNSAHISHMAEYPSE